MFEKVPHSQASEGFPPIFLIVCDVHSQQFPSYGTIFGSIFSYCFSAEVFTQTARSTFSGRLITTNHTRIETSKEAGMDQPTLRPREFF
jgi:hypothetical protein